MLKVVPVCGGGSDLTSSGSIWTRAGLRFFLTIRFIFFVVSFGLRTVFELLGIIALLVVSSEERSEIRGFVSVAAVYMVESWSMDGRMG